MFYSIQVGNVNRAPYASQAFSLAAIKVIWRLHSHEKSDMPSTVGKCHLNTMTIKVRRVTDDGSGNPKQANQTDIFRHRTGTATLRRTGYTAQAS
ncbi:hypothetical protein DESC_310087 [Desulfosarcina cetonica]|nr:hypothetical protein DESC_310087 [Desulfosarcina cetonica]